MKQILPYKHILESKTDLDEELLEQLRTNYIGECSEVGMYLAMSRVAQREGYEEIAKTYEIIAYKEAEHALKFAEILGEVVNPSIEENLKVRVEAEYCDIEIKLKIAKKAKKFGIDTVYDTVMDMCKDEARHSKVFLDLLKRYFKEYN